MNEGGNRFRSRMGARASGWARPALALVVAVGVVGGIFVLSGTQTSAKGGGKLGGKGKLANVSVAAVTSAALAQQLTLPGLLSASSSSNVYPAASGQVTTVYVSLGQSVTAGNAVVRLSDTQNLSGQLNAAQAALTSAQDTLQMASGAPTTASSGVTISGDQAKVASAQAQVQTLQAQLNAETVVAPISGVVSNLAVAVGDVVTPSSLLATIQGSGLQVQAMVSPSQMGELAGRTGTQATATLADASSSASSSAVLSSLSPAADPSTGDFTASFSVNAPTSLYPGEPVTVSLSIPAGTGLVVPSGSIVYPSGFPEVFEVSNLTPFHGAPKNPKGGKKHGAGASNALTKKIAGSLRGETGVATLVPVQLGVESGSNQEITSGLTSGSTIVVAGETELSDGARVVVLGGHAGANSAGSPSGSGPSGTQTRTVHLPIAGVQGSTLSVTTHRGVKHIAVSASAVITLNGHKVSLSALKAGDKATLRIQRVNGKRTITAIAAVGTTR